MPRMASWRRRAWWRRPFDRPASTSSPTASSARCRLSCWPSADRDISRPAASQHGEVIVANDFGLVSLTEIVQKRYVCLLRLGFRGLSAEPSCICNPVPRPDTLSVNDQ